MLVGGLRGPLPRTLQDRRTAGQTAWSDVKCIFQMTALAHRHTHTLWKPWPQPKVFVAENKGVKHGGSSQTDLMDTFPSANDAALVRPEINQNVCDLFQPEPARSVRSAPPAPTLDCSRSCFLHVSRGISTSVTNSLCYYQCWCVHVHISYGIIVYLISSQAVTLCLLSSCPQMPVYVSRRP